MTAGTPTGRTMVFHVPYPLNPSATSASGIRPVKMRRAFDDAGFRVLEVSGSAARRRIGMERVRRFIDEGGTIDFAYSESSTLPTLLTESHHFPTHPRLDFSFFRRLRRAGVPIGLYYRDVYWAFPEYRQANGAFLPLLTVPLYRHDLREYRRLLTRLYLQSPEMADHVPGAFPPSQIGVLPPGADIVDHGRNPHPGRVRLLYVGGVNRDHYRLQQCVAGVGRVDGASMVLCTRAVEWEAVRGDYADVLDPGHVDVVHESGAALEARYAAADIGVMFFEPSDYRSFVAPFKLYEYLGHGLPVIATEGTLAAEIVQADGLGWVLPYRADALAQLLVRLRDDPALIDEAGARVRSWRAGSTWTARAEYVARDLAP